MNRNNLPALLLILGAGACTTVDQPRTAGADLSGNWTGTYETVQAGTCTWSGPASEAATATWQVVNNTITGTVSRQVGQSSSSKQFTGTLNGNVVSVGETTNAVCNGTSRSYVSRFSGTVMGNTLTLTSRDTLCPAQGCIFGRTLRLTRL